jgi:hypothetical protein
MAPKMGVFRAEALALGSQKNGGLLRTMAGSKIASFALHPSGSGRVLNGPHVG